MRINSFFRNITVLSAIMFSISSCSDDTIIEYRNPFLGVFSNTYVDGLSGFNESRSKILAQEEISNQDFIVWSTDSAWALSPEHKKKLRAVRNSISMPSKQVLLQKVISLDDVINYMDNTYGGNISGYVFDAGDIKHLDKIYDIYWGLRLDYPGSKFKEDGAGYAVIRFKSELTDRLRIPYCVELGGEEQHDWPNTGGGFTASTLGAGGIPEYIFTGYTPPMEGAELYEITPNGIEILRSVYQTGKWVTYESNNLSSKSKKPVFKRISYNGYKANFNGIEFKAYLKNNGVVLVSDNAADHFVYDEENNHYELELKRNQVTELRLVQTVTTYKGHLFHVSGEDISHFYLTTNDASLQSKLGLNVIEKGIYGITIRKDLNINLSEQ